jgi:hypothetical protein
MQTCSFDLATINAAQKAAVFALKAYVCELEQSALDAARRRDYQSAKLQSDWAFAADLCIHKVSGALSELFMEALNQPPIKSHTTVELPSLERHQAKGQEWHVELAKVRVLHAENPEPPAA